MKRNGIEKTQSVRINQDVVKEIKRFIIDNGGTIRSILEEGAALRMKKLTTKLK